jgi:hypothetical protein
MFFGQFLGHVLTMLGMVTVFAGISGARSKQGGRKGERSQNCEDLFLFHDEKLKRSVSFCKCHATEVKTKTA